MKEVKYYIKRYIQEMVEVFIALFVYKAIVGKTIDLKKLFFMTSVVGFFTMLLEEYDKKYNSTVKGSLLMAVTSQTLTV